MASIEKAVQWMESIAKDDTHGYDQEFRNGPDYDCSSFVSTGLKEGGFAISGSNTTRTLYKNLTKIGFVVVSGERKRGDIFLKEGYHVVCCTSSTHIVHASINENGEITGGQSGDQTGKEIYIRTYYNHPTNGWDYHLRYVGEDYDILPTNWVSKNTLLTESEMNNNAYLVFKYFSARGWTLNAIAGMLGNMQSESMINPGVYENINDSTKGYGLVQWTPSTKVIDWLTENGYDIDVANENGNGQCARLQYEMANAIQWYSSGPYADMTFAEYSVSTLSPSDLAYAFMICYERPSDINQPERQERAEYWYSYFKDYDAEPDDSQPEYFKRKKKRYKFVLFNYRRRQ